MQLNSTGNTIDTAANTFTLAGAGVSGAGALNKIGSGRLVLATANTYTGGTNLNAGDIQINNSASLGTGTLTMAAATSLTAGNAGLSVGNSIVLNGPDTIDSAAFNLTLTGVVSGSGPLAKIGSGTLTLNGANTYTGVTNLNVGTITIGNNTALGTSTLSMAGSTTLQAGAAGLALANAIGIVGSGVTIDTQGFGLTLNGVVSGQGYTKIGASTLTLNGANTTAATIFLNGGQITVGTSTALGTSTLNMNSNTALQAGVAGLSLANAINLFGLDTIDTQGFGFTLGGTINGSGTLNKIGSGTLTLNGANGYTGGTNLTAGAITVGTNTALGTGLLAMTGGTILTAGANNLILANAITTLGGGRIDSGATSLTPQRQYQRRGFDQPDRNGLT